MMTMNLRDDGLYKYKITIIMCDSSGVKSFKILKCCHDGQYRKFMDHYIQVLRVFFFNMLETDQGRHVWWNFSPAYTC